MNAPSQSLVVYSNPLQQWFWETGIGYWVYGFLLLLLLSLLILAGHLFVAANLMRDR